MKKELIAVLAGICVVSTALSGCGKPAAASEKDTVKGRIEIQRL